MTDRSRFFSTAGGSFEVRARFRRFAWLVALSSVLAAPAAAAAQSRPVATEDPETVPAGFILLEGGFDYLSGTPFPASGLKGDLTRLATFGLSIGVSGIAEIQIDGGLRRRLNISSFDTSAPLASRYTGGSTSTSSADDLYVGAKVRFVSETATRPAIAFRFATKLPTAGSRSGLGTGTTDVHVEMAVAKTIRSVRIAVNAGVATLGDTTTAARTNNLFSYGLSLARAVATGVELVADVNGRLDAAGDPPPPGAESRSGVRLGGRLTRGPVRLDGGLHLGLTDADPSWGLTAGFTWVFKAFEVK